MIDTWDPEVSAAYLTGQTGIPSLLPFLLSPQKVLINCEMNE